ncbi:MAG: VWA domain-containing protein [Candidatus Binataceae bacterium]
MKSLKHRITDFVAELRAAGVRISVAETIDAMHAVAAAGLARGRMREALAAALIKDESDRAAFDATFASFFASPSPERGDQSKPRRGDQLSAARGRGRLGMHAPEEPTERKDDEPGDAPLESQPSGGAPARPEETAEHQRGAPAHRADDGDRDARSDASEGSEAAHHARLRALERTPFARYTALQYDEARDALRPLERRFRARLGRRLRLARRGRLDFRRTIRASLQHGGALADLRFRSRRPRRIDLVILADVSGSVRYATELLLELVAGARECFRSVRSFVYIDRLAEADFEHGHLVMTPPLDLYARSDFGRVLRELWERRAGLLGRATVVVVLGDGRNNRRPARADILRDIARTVRAVVWLNPEERQRWGTGDSAIQQYAREVTALLAAGNLRELEKGLERVA